MAAVNLTDAAKHDDFDAIIDAESRFQEEGFNKGIEAGKETGYLDGFATGLEQGRAIASEIGFYVGFVEQILNSTETSDIEDKKMNRKVKALQSLDKNLKEFNIRDPHAENFAAALGNIRAKFKQVCSLFGAASLLPGNGNLQF